MSKRGKLLESLKQSPNNVTFAQIRKLLELENLRLKELQEVITFSNAERQFLLFPYIKTKSKPCTSNELLKSSKNMGKVKYPFVIYPDAEGGYVAEIPALKGCLAQGETLSETLEELETVENLWLETAHQKGLELPKVEIEIERVKQKLAA